VASGVACVILHLAVLIQHRRMTYGDGRTDGRQTDEHTTTVNTVLAQRRAVKIRSTLESGRERTVWSAYSVELVLGGEVYSVETICATWFERKIGGLMDNASGESTEEDGETKRKREESDMQKWSEVDTISK